MNETLSILTRKEGTIFLFFFFVNEGTIFFFFGQEGTIFIFFGQPYSFFFGQRSTIFHTMKNVPDWDQAPLDWPNSSSLELHASLAHKKAYANERVTHVLVPLWSAL